MDKISSKTGVVAVLPKFRLPLNLQLFAEDAYPELEDTPEFKEDAKEFNAKMDKFVEERESKKAPVEKVVEEEKPAKEVEKAATPDVAVPDDKPKQDSDTNKAFQEMRKQLEAEQARAKKADEVISKEWGHLGVHTVEQYEQRLQQDRLDEENQRYTDAGLTSEEIDKIRKYDELQNKSAAEQQEKVHQENAKHWQSLYTAYPDIAESSKAFTEGKEPEWFNESMKAELARGASPLAAYRNAHFETILANATKGTKEAAKQEALNALNSKNHMKPSGSEGGDVDHVEIDAETMRMYRSLNKGKSDAEIRKWHKKYAS